ncbi:growth factor receptor-bound protein 14-like isoform X2 [Tachypleus tridentatus]
MNCLHLTHSFLGTPTIGKDSQNEEYDLLMDTGYNYPLLPVTGNKTDQTTVKEVALYFYLEDGRHHHLIVEEGLRATDLCNLLTLKFSVARSHAWTIVEQFRDLGIERILEDHEEVLQTYASFCNLSSRDRRFILRQDIHKYQFFQNPENFYPLELVDLELQHNCLTQSTAISKIITIQNMLHLGNSMPVVQSFLWFKDSTKYSWRKYFFRIEERLLSFSLFPEKEQKKMHALLDVQCCDIFMPIDGKCTGAPTNFCFCVKLRTNLEGSFVDLKWFCSATEKGRKCWIVALRLAKFGKKLRENYREAKSRSNSVDNSTLCFNKGEHHDMASDSLSSNKVQVAMDFTGKFGRMVQNPVEIKAIAAIEAQNKKKQISTFRAQHSPDQTTFEFGIHTLQPWFYGSMTREEATQLLTKYVTVDGVFLVRESHRNPGSFVLSYAFNQKILHTQIYPMEEKNQLCFTLDGGKTKFYDLLQLVEFYQLNLGYLPTKLTHFFVHQPRRRESPP